MSDAWAPSLSSVRRVDEALRLIGVRGLIGVRRYDQVLRVDETWRIGQALLLVAALTVFSLPTPALGQATLCCKLVYPSQSPYVEQLKPSFAFAATATPAHVATATPAVTPASAAHDTSDVSTTSTRVDSVLPKASIWPAVPEHSAHHQIASDSLLRWRPSRTLSGWLYEEGAGTLFRLGTIGRSEAFHLNAMEPRHASLQLESMELADPITGGVHWDIIPYAQIASIARLGDGVGSETKIHLREHYVRDPRLYLNFFESGAQIRDLNVLYTHNLSRRFNVELGYDDLRDALPFSGMDVKGTRIQGRVHFQLNPNLRIKAGVLDYASSADESFGYVEGSMIDFTFDPLTIRPKVSNAVRQIDQFNAYVKLERWTPAGEGGLGHAQLGGLGHAQLGSRSTLGVYRQTFDNVLSYPARPAEAGVGRWEMHLQHQRHAKRLGIESEIRLRHETLSGASLSAVPGDPFLQAFATAGFHYAFSFGPVVSGSLRLSRRTGSDLAASSRIGLQMGGEPPSPMQKVREFTSETPTPSQPRISPGLLLEVLGGRTEPDYQSLFWNANNVFGTPSLAPEEFLQVSTTAWLRARNGVVGQIRGDLRRTEQAVWLPDLVNGAGVSFQSAPRYYSLAANAMVGLHRRLLEADVTLNWNTFLIPALVSLDDFQRRISRMDPMLWLRARAYVTTPIYRQAAFTRMGATLRYLPEQQSASAYHPSLGRWMTGTDPRRLPESLLLDVHASTRLRWMMIQLSVEDVLDGVTRQGVFGSPGYPLSGRRFIFGIQVLFKH